MSSRSGAAVIAGRPHGARGGEAGIDIALEGGIAKISDLVRALEQRLEATETRLQHLSDEVIARVEASVGAALERAERRFAEQARQAVEQALASELLARELAARPRSELVEFTGTSDELLAPFLVDEEEETRLLGDDPDMLDTKAFQAELGLSHTAIHDKRKAGKVLALTQTGRKIWYPRQQIGPNRTLVSGIDRVLDAFEGDAWEAHRFLKRWLPGLGGSSGYEGLAANRVEEVLTAIQAVDEDSYD